MEVNCQLDEIARELGVSVERARNIELEALKKVAQKFKHQFPKIWADFNVSPEREVETAAALVQLAFLTE